MSLKKHWLLYLIFIGQAAYCQSDSLRAEKHSYLQLTFANNYQHNNFVNTDFTGINIFVYQNKFRFSSNVSLSYDLSEKYFLLVGIRMQDVGWKRLDTAHVVEPHPDQWIFSFLYLSPSVGMGRWICHKKHFGFNIALGVDPEFRIYESEKLFYSQHTVKNTNPDIQTVKYNTLFWLSLHGCLPMGKYLFVGVDYLIGMNYQSFHKIIIPKNPLVQSVGVSFGTKLK